MSAIVTNIMYYVNVIHRFPNSLEGNTIFNYLNLHHLGPFKCNKKILGDLLKYL